MTTTMKRNDWFNSILRQAIVFFLWICLAAPVFAEEAKDESSPKAGLDEFKLIWERNIFNPDRKKPLSDSEIVRPPAAPQIDQFTLVGAMITETESFAFFDGSESAFRSVFKKGDQIAGYTIQEIRSDGVVLTQNDQPIDMPVGKAMERQDQGEWKVVEGARIARSGSRSSSDSRGSRSPSGSSKRSDNALRSGADSKKDTSSTGDESGSDSQSDILKRLMEKRKQEMQK